MKPNSIINETRIARMANEIDSLKTFTERKLGAKFGEINEVLTETKQVAQDTKETLKEIKSKAENLDSKFEVLSDEVVEVLKEIKENGLKGEPGESADEQAIEDRLLAKIPKLEEIVQNLPNEQVIANRVLKMIPENKPSLKIIQESLDLDAVANKIKQTLSIEDLKDWKETRKALETHATRGKGGYHGGGFNNIASASGVVSTGLDTLKFTGAGVNSVTQSGRTVTVNISGGGGSGSPGGLNTQLQYNDAGSFGGIAGATTDGTVVTFTTGNLVGADVKSSSSAGLSLLTSSGSTTFLSGAGGGVNNTAYGSLKLDYSTVSTIAIIDSSNNLISASTATYPSLTELSYVKGVTSSIQTQLNAKGAGTVTSVAQSFTGGLISVSGSPITSSGTLALTVAGTSGGVPYFSSASTWASSAALTANALMIGGGAGAAPSTTTTGTGVLTALGISVGSAGAFVTYNGALGTPSSGTLTNATGLPISGLVSSTSTALGVGSLELGNASDTTLSRSSAGVLAVEGVVIPSISSTSTLTNKRMQPRYASSTSASTLTPDLSSANIYFRTTQTATLTIKAPTGTPVTGETIMIYVDSASSQTLTIDSTYKAFGADFPASTTAGKTFMMSAQYNGTDWKTLWANAQ